MCVCNYYDICECGNIGDTKHLWSQGTAFGSWFSPSPVLVLGTALRSSWLRLFSAACSSPWAVCALCQQHLPLPWPIHTASNQLLNECVIKHRVWQSIQLKDLLGRFLYTTLPSTHFPLLKSERILNLPLTQTQPASTWPHWQLSELTRSGLMWGAPHSWPASSSVDS